MRTIATIAALLVLTGCYERAPGYYIADCLDAYSGQHFTLDSRNLFDPTLNLTGESYARFRLPDGRVIRVTDSWGEQNCKILEAHGR